MTPETKSIGSLSPDAKLHGNFARLSLPAGINRQVPADQDSASRHGSTAGSGQNYNLQPQRAGPNCSPISHVRSGSQSAGKLEDSFIRGILLMYLSRPTNERYILRRLLGIP